ncbi:MAG TPA: penicillin-binding protein 2 [Pyrinomonadaceae bacterium]|nr:penicillin-binding protein 2 [Pyrinomonadaceae bacterium]
MKFEDDSQNLRLRVRIIYIFALVLLIGLGIRLYYLQVVRGQFYAERAENQRIRKLTIPAQRGAIYDRNRNLLVNSRLIYNVILSREDVKGKDLLAMVEPLSAGLQVDAEILRERFDDLKSLPAFESIKVKENATTADIAWIDAHAVEYPELRIEEQPQRSYMDGGVLAHVIGYVGEISKMQLENPRFKEKGYHPGDIIGQEGIEAVYDDYLRGRDGYRKVVVDSSGHIQDVLETVPPQPGQDLVTTIDLEMQLTAEEQLRNSPSKRGVIVALDPHNGEVLAMASSPTFDPNVFSQNVTSRENRAQISALLRDPLTPLYNRAIRGRYPPGSTWKTLMALAGLKQGAITVKQSNIVCGGGIQVGNKFTRCYGGNHGAPELRYAIIHSCDGYFYRLGLKMGLKGIQEMVDEFDLNKRTGIDLPHELISWTPSQELKARFNPRDPQWKDIDTVYASFGQVSDIMTPISMIRAVTALGNGGKLYVPHLLKEARAIGSPGTPDYRPAHTFDRPEPKIIPMDEDQRHLVVEGMWGVVNAGGTGGGIKMAGFDIAGKTGTAQVVARGKEGTKNRDHSWFVSFAPAYKPEISIIALIENVGFGGRFAAPAVRNIYNVYYRQTRGEEAPGAQVAKKSEGKPGVKPADKPTAD